MATEPTYNPFSEADYENVNECLAACGQLEDFIGRCERCDIGMAEAREQLAKLQAFYSKLKAEFFPNRP